MAEEVLHVAYTTVEYKSKLNYYYIYKTSYSIYSENITDELKNHTFSL